MSIEYITIKNFTKNNGIRNFGSRFGLQTAEMILDSLGLPDSILFKLNADGTFDYTKTKGENPRDCIIETGFVPTIPIYTVIELLYGNLEILDTSGNLTGKKSVRFEERKLSVDKTKTPTVVHYFLNNVKQSYTYTPLSMNKSLRLADSAVIGNPDLLYMRQDFEIYSEVYEPSQTNSIGGVDGTKWLEDEPLIDTYILLKD